MDGSQITKSISIGFYKRLVQVGDYAYADGSCSNLFDDGKTVVGIVWLVDKTTGKALIFTPKPMSRPFQWGNDQSSLKLTDDADFNTVFILGIPGLDFKYKSATDAVLRDSNTEDGWKVYDSNALWRSGFVTLPYAMGKYSEGDVIPVSMRDTLFAITHRNKILRDSGINLPVPYKNASQTETQNLDSLIASANSNPGNAYRYYWPAFSYCYAYEPSVKPGEILAEKYKSHNWALPTPGDLARIYWLIDNQFKQNIPSSILSPLPDLAWTTQQEPLGKNGSGALTSWRAFSYDGSHERTRYFSCYAIAEL